MTPRRTPKRVRHLTLKRLRAGAVVLKTTSPEAKHGAFWTYLATGHLAAASVCHDLERLGLLVSADHLPGMEGGQTYAYAPLEAFTRPHHGKRSRQKPDAGDRRSRSSPPP